MIDTTADQHLHGSAGTLEGPRFLLVELPRLV